MPTSEKTIEIHPTIEERTAIVYRLLCRGLNRETIALYGKEKEWNASPAELDSYIERATAQLVTRAHEIDTEAELGLAIERLNDLYMKADKVQDTRTALQVQKEITKTLALKVQAEAFRQGRAPVPATEKPRLKIAK